MVADGGFRLSIVDATTKQPLRERVDKGDIGWVQGEEGHEFFVTVGVDKRPASRPPNPPAKYVHACIYVDGKDLGYHMRFQSCYTSTSPPLGPAKAGQAWNEEGVVHAFKFERGTSGGGNWHVGSVTVVFRRATLQSSAAVPKTTIQTWTGQTASAALHHKEQSSLHAGVGTTPGKMPNVASRPLECHEVLGVLTLRYTSDMGLAVRGMEADTPPCKKVKTEDKKPGGTSKQDAIVLE